MHKGKCGVKCGRACRGEMIPPDFRSNVKALVEEIVSILQAFPHERSLDKLRERLEPVELEVFPELRG